MTAQINSKWNDDSMQLHTYKLADKKNQWTIIRKSVRCVVDSEYTPMEIDQCCENFAVLCLGTGDSKYILTLNSFVLQSLRIYFYPALPNCQRV